jgi:hypothetical protein
LVVDLVLIVKGPLYLSQCGKKELIEAAFNLDGVVRKPSIRRTTADRGGIIEFEDWNTVENFDKVIFGTGYRLSYPFLTPGPVTSQSRLAGFYQHIFKIGDSTLAVVGQVFLKFPSWNSMECIYSTWQVKVAASFRVHEYPAVAVAAFLAGRASKFPCRWTEVWEKKRLEYKGPTNLFHEIKPDFAWILQPAGGLCGQAHRRE